jgi:hypothetical protein
VHRWCKSLWRYQLPKLVELRRCLVCPTDNDYTADNATDNDYTTADDDNATDDYTTDNDYATSNDAANNDPTTSNDYTANNDYATIMDDEHSALRYELDQGQQ